MLLGLKAGWCFGCRNVGTWTWSDFMFFCNYLVRTRQRWCVDWCRVVKVESRLVAWLWNAWRKYLKLASSGLGGKFPKSEVQKVR